MLVSIALTAATVCMACAWTKRLDETQWPEAQDETYCGPRPRHIAQRLRQDRDETLVRLKTENFVVTTSLFPGCINRSGLLTWTQHHKSLHCWRYE